MKIETPRTDELSKIVQNQNWGFRDMQLLAEKLERELNQWRDIATRLAENGGGLRRYDALKYSAAIDEYKRMAAMPNIRS